MRTILGAAIGAIAFWLAMLAAAVTYIVEHIFAIGLAVALVVAVILASRLIDRRRHTCARPTQPALPQAPRRHRPAAINAVRTAGTTPTAHLRKVV